MNYLLKFVVPEKERIAPMLFAERAAVMRNAAFYSCQGFTTYVWGKSSNRILAVFQGGEEAGTPHLNPLPVGARKLAGGT